MSQRILLELKSADQFVHHAVAGKPQRGAAELWNDDDEENRFHNLLGICFRLRSDILHQIKTNS